MVWDLCGCVGCMWLMWQRGRHIWNELPVKRSHRYHTKATQLNGGWCVPQVLLKCRQQMRTPIMPKISRICNPCTSNWWPLKIIASYNKLGTLLPLELRPVMGLWVCVCVSNWMRRLTSKTMMHIGVQSQHRTNAYGQSALSTVQVQFVISIFSHHTTEHRHFIDDICSRKAYLNRRYMNYGVWKWRRRSLWVINVDRRYQLPYQDVSLDLVLLET